MGYDENESENRNMIEMRPLNEQLIYENRAISEVEFDLEEINNASISRFVGMSLLSILSGPGCPFVFGCSIGQCYYEKKFCQVTRVYLAEDSVVMETNDIGARWLPCCFWPGRTMTVPLDAILDIQCVKSGPCCQLSQLNFQTAAHGLTDKPELMLCGVKNAHEFRNQVIQQKRKLRLEQRTPHPTPIPIITPPTNLIIDSNSNTNNDNNLNDICFTQINHSQPFNTKPQFQISNEIKSIVIKKYSDSESNVKVPGVELRFDNFGDLNDLIVKAGSELFINDPLFICRQDNIKISSIDLFQPNQIYYLVSKEQFNNLY
eukprot:TRINITY_DN3326_c0_g1_i1.p1 TRINITY_DN3326_c0_g1~~TRINITY_DN3326_c0_g1_i1.p1  ORF type:complete len:318 (+),score=131.45 TRINITY_DN3326_c0_g1_i1:90-1043(+)